MWILHLWRFSSSLKMREKVTSTRGSGQSLGSTPAIEKKIHPLYHPQKNGSTTNMSHDEGHYLLHLHAILIQSFFSRSVIFMGESRDPTGSSRYSWQSEINSYLFATETLSPLCLNQFDISCNWLVVDAPELRTYTMFCWSFGIQLGFFRWEVVVHDRNYGSMVLPR